MKLVDFLPAACFVPELESTSKKSVLSELLDPIVELNHLKKGRKQAVLEALMAREKLGSTGIGKGIAVPHAKHEAIEKLIGAVGLSPKGVEFHSLDGQPADLIFLVLSPPQCSRRTQALRLVTQFVKEDDLCRFLREAKDGREVHEVLREAEARLEII